MRFYLLDWFYCIPRESSRIILFGPWNIVKNKSNGEEIIWNLDIPPFKVIKELKVKYKV